jgi:predicted nucleic acid-binding protein
LPRRGVGISIRTKIELLGYPKLGPTEERLIAEVLQDLEVWPVDEAVAVAAISIRRRHTVKIPDAVIAATAIVYGKTLLTNDLELSKIDGLKCRSVKLRPPPH